MASRKRAEPPSSPAPEDRPPSKKVPSSPSGAVQLPNFVPRRDYDSDTGSEEECETNEAPPLARTAAKGKAAERVAKETPNARQVPQLHKRPKMSKQREAPPTPLHITDDNTETSDEEAQGDEQEPEDEEPKVDWKKVDKAIREEARANLNRRHWKIRNTPRPPVVHSDKVARGLTCIALIRIKC